MGVRYNGKMYMSQRQADRARLKDMGIFGYSVECWSVQRSVWIQVASAKTLADARQWVMESGDGRWQYRISHNGRSYSAK
jgi:hypothetical protein